MERGDHPRRCASIQHIHNDIIAKHGQRTSQAGKWKKAQVVRLRRTESLSFHANKYERPKVKTSKTERKATVGRGKHLKPQEKMLASTMLSRRWSIEQPRIIVGRARKATKETKLPKHHGRQVGQQEVIKRLQVCLGCVHP